ncbi:MAG: DUF1778 domain-containing protein [Terriglobia bacterium]
MKVDRRPREGERLEARVTTNQRRVFERAGQLRGTSVTDFLVGTASKQPVKRSRILKC